MPTFYNFTQDGLTYSFDDVFVPADMFRSGNLWIWGSENNGMLGNGGTSGLVTYSTPITTFAGGANWKQISCSTPSLSRFSAAIKTDGTLWTWGSVNFGSLGNRISSGTISTPVTTFTGGTNWKQVSVGSRHTAAIKTDGTLWVWGTGGNGRLGNATAVLLSEISTPITTFAGGTNWKQVNAGSKITSAIKTDGTLWTWGYGSHGQLGTLQNFTGFRTTPVTTFAGATSWLEELYTISAGGKHTAAIKTDGTLWIWGKGNSGSLGNANTTDRSTPVTTFSGGTNWKQISVGEESNPWIYSVGIKTDGTLWTWGYEDNGRHGAGSNISPNRVISTPITTFAGGTNWKQVDATASSVTAIKTDGTLWVWGNSQYGQLGNARTTSVNSTPSTTFAGGTNWKQVSGGRHHTAAIKTDGTLWVWGNQSEGQLGNRIITSITSTPVTTHAGGTNWRQVSCGNENTAAIKTDGTLWTWGYGNTGQLGNARYAFNISTPVTTFAGGTNWKQVSVGSKHTAAIKTDGTLWTWGKSDNFGTQTGSLGHAATTNASTPVTTFAGGTNWKQVNCGLYYTIAIRDDGVNRELFSWGTGFDGNLGNAQNTTANSTPVTTFAGGTDWKQIGLDWADTATTNPEDLYTLSSGGGQTAAIKTDGTLWTWGNGSLGQIGNAVTTNRFTPVTTFAGGTNWKQISCGNQHTAAIKTDGTLWTWGNGQFGRLGNAATTSTISTPVTTFTGGTDWKQISAGSSVSAAIKTDGTLWTWGGASSGQLGNADTTGNISTPVTTFTGGTNWKQVSSGGATGGAFVGAIKTDGTLWTWGLGNNGRLGNATTTTTNSTPVTTFAGGTNWKQISCGNQHIAAIKTDGTLWVWGSGNSGRLGNAVTTNVSTPVTTFTGGTNWKQVSSGYRHTAAIKTDGTLWAWGNGFYGRLGTANVNNVSTPVTTFAGGTNWKQVSAGNENTVALNDDGVTKELFIWGEGREGELGLVTLFNISTPITTFAGGTNWKQVSSGDYHTTAIKTDGTLWTWGNSTLGQVGNAVTTDVFTPVTTFAGGTNWKQVNAGATHTAAIKTDGTLWTWGNGGFGSLGDNTSTNKSTPVTTQAGGTNWKQVSAGENRMAAIKIDGTLWIWGDGGDGGLGAPGSSNRLTPITTFLGGTNWKQVSSGSEHTAAIIYDDPVL